MVPEVVAMPRVISLDLGAKRNDPPCAELFHDETTEGRSHVAARYRIARKDARPISRSLLPDRFHGSQRSTTLCRIRRWTALGTTAKERRSDRSEARHRTANAPAIPRIHQVGPRRSTPAMPQGGRRANSPTQQAIGVIDETGTAKAGKETVGVKRQYNGNRGKVENASVSVALSFATATFQCLIATRMYLPEDWASDPVRRKELMFQTIFSFWTKP